MVVDLYRLSYEDGEYCIGTETEVIDNHNEWVENSGRFELDEINDNLATKLEDLMEHWTVEKIYTVQVRNSDYEMRLATYHKEVDYLENYLHLLWSYIPEDDWGEISKKIEKEMEK